MPVFLYSLSLLVLLTIFFFLKEDYVFLGDTLVKVLQSHSLLVNRFRSEDLFYPFKSYDPGYEFFSVDPPLFLNLPDRKISPFPLLYALLIVPAVQWNPVYIVLQNLLLLWVTGLFLRITENLSFFLYFLFLSGSYVLLNTIDGSESIYLLLSQTLGLYFFFRNSRPMIEGMLASFFFALGMWFRLEMLIYISAFLAVWFVLRRKEIFHDRAEKRKFLTFVLFTLIFLAIFFGFHYRNYGHIFGPRYIVNYSAPVGIYIRLQNLITMLFGIDYYKLGFFTYMPVFLFVSFWFLRNIFHYGFREKFLFFSTTITLFLIGTGAPNDGVVNFGPRYMVLGIIPFLLLTDSIFRMSKEKRKWIILLSLFSFSVTFFYIVTIKNKARIIHKVSNIVEKELGDVTLVMDEFEVVNTGTGLLHTAVVKIRPQQLPDIERKLIPGIKQFLHTHQKIVFFYSNLTRQKYDKEIREVKHILDKHFTFLEEKEITVVEGKLSYTFFRWKKD